MTTARYSTALIVAVVLTAAATHAQTPELAQKVLDAYQQTQSYASTIAYESVYQEGRWKHMREAEVYTAFDRSANRVLVDRPQVVFGSDGSSMVLILEQIGGRYLEAPLNELPVSLDDLTGVLPALEEPTLPDVVLLLDDQPWQTLAAVSQPTIEELEPAQDDARPRLRVSGTLGSWTLSIDPQTSLVTRAEHTLDAEAHGMPAGDSMTERFDITIEARNEPLGPDRLAFDTAGREAVASLEKLAGGPAQQPQQQQMADKDALVGGDAPEIDLPLLGGGQFKLSEAPTRVVVLDFWATWCGPCIAAMPKLQEVADWAEREGKDAQIYAVNLQEEPDKVQRFWDQNGYTMPVVLDRQGTAAQAYGVTGIPQTVVIVDGKVTDVHVGFSPDIAETLKRQINEGLADDE